MACDTKPSCIVDDKIAFQRRFLYTDTKINDMNACHPNGLEPDLPTHSVDAFLKVLNFVVNSTAPFYDGLRVYFACFPTTTSGPGGNLIPAGHEGSMTLIYVPTFMKNGEEHTDDVANCMFITDNDVVPLPNANTSSGHDDIASAWILNFRQKLIHLEQLGTSFINDNFFETRSMWYPLESFTDQDATHPGLISYISCLNSLPPDQNPTDRLIPKLACYLKVDSIVGVFYQLTILFGIHRVNDPAEVISFVGTPNRRPGKPDADTGLPCPPNKGCLEQSLLPVNH